MRGATDQEIFNHLNSIKCMEEGDKETLRRFEEDLEIQKRLKSRVSKF